jgi:hypothetical protein
MVHLLVRGPDPYDTFFHLHLAVCLLLLETFVLIQLLIFFLARIGSAISSSGGATLPSN